MFYKKCRHIIPYSWLRSDTFEQEWFFVFNWVWYKFWRENMLRREVKIMGTKCTQLSKRWKSYCSVIQRLSRLHIALHLGGFGSRYWPRNKNCSDVCHGFPQSLHHHTIVHFKLWVSESIISLLCMHLSSLLLRVVWSLKSAV